MDDDVFLAKLNEISREHRLKLTAVEPGSPRAGAVLANWAKFLESCVKKGISLSDSRWKRLTVRTNSPYTRFALEGDGQQVDHDFRVGLQLLMGLLDKHKDAKT